MFDLKVKVYKPDYKSHDLSFMSILSSNFGSAQLVFNAHAFAGETVKLGIEYLMKFQPMLSPAFQRYKVRFDSFVIPEDTHFKDVLKFYKVGGIKKEIPAPSLDPWKVYLAVLIDSIFYRGFSPYRLNPWCDTLVDDLNFPTFDDALDRIRIMSDSELCSAANSIIGSITGFVPGDLDSLCSELSGPKQTLLPFFHPDMTCRSNLIMTLFVYSVLFGIEVWESELPVELFDRSRSPLYDLHILGKDINLLPFLSYQSLWREFYRNGWVDDADSGDNGIDSFGLVPYLPTDVDVLELISIFDDETAQLANPFAVYSDYLTEWESPYSRDSYWIGSNDDVQVVPAIRLFGRLDDANIEYSLNRIHTVFGRFDVNFVNDYFTSASINSEGENKVSIPLTSSLFASNSHETQAVGISAPPGGGAPFVGSTGAVRGQVSVINSGSIPDLRIANVMQIIEEKSALASGNRPYEFYKLFFGHIIPDSRLHRPSFLGRCRKYVNIQEVTQTGMSTEGQPLGDIAGKGSSIGSDGLFSISVDEPSWIQVVMSIVPDASYFQGFPVELVKTDPYDFLIPDFQHIGMRSIDSSELYVGVGSSRDELDASFGFTDVYNEYRCRNNEIHGEFRNSMAYWTSVRRFNSMPRLNRDFIRVNSVDAELYKPFAITDGYTSHVISQLWFNYTHIRPLDIYPVYSL